MTHVEICIARCHFGSHCCPRLLNIVLALKSEIVASKNEVHEFHDSFPFVIGKVVEVHKIVACFYATIIIMCVYRDLTSQVTKSVSGGKV